MLDQSERAALEQCGELVTWVVNNHSDASSCPVLGLASSIKAELDTLSRMLEEDGHASHY